MSQPLTPEQDYFIKIMMEHNEGKRTGDELEAAYEMVRGKGDTPPYLEGIDPVTVARWNGEWPDHSATFGREFYSATKFIARYEQGQDDWVWDTLLPRGEVMALVGARGEGKTFIGLGAAISAATARDFGPFKTGGRGRFVLYITEEALGGVAKRIKNYQAKWGIPDDEIDKVFFLQAKVHQLVESNGGRDPVIKVQDLHRMIRAAQERGELPNQIDLVVLDYFRRSIIDANENDNGHVAKALSGLYDLAEALDCGIMVVHHKGKNKEGGARGASVFGDFVYAVLVTEGGDLSLVEENISGDLVFLNTEKETNKLSASGAGGKQPKDGKLEDYRYVLVKQQHNTAVFIDQELVRQVGLNEGLSALAQNLKAYLMMRPGQHMPRRVVIADMGVDPGNLTNAWKELAGKPGFASQKAGRSVEYMYGSVI